MNAFMRNVLLTLAVLMCLAGCATLAGAGELPRPSRCDRYPIDQSAVPAVAALPEFKAKALDVRPLDLTFADFGLTAAELGSHCGTTVSVYVSHPDRLELWRTFFFDSELHAVTYATGAEGTFHKLSAPRSSDK